MFQALIGPIASLAGSFVEGQVSKQRRKQLLHKLRRKQKLK